MDRVAMRVKLDGYKHASNCCKHMKILLWSSEDTVETNSLWGKCHFTVTVISGRIGLLTVASCIKHQQYIKNTNQIHIYNTETI